MLKWLQNSFKQRDFYSERESEHEHKRREKKELLQFNKSLDSSAFFFNIQMKRKTSVNVEGNVWCTSARWRGYWISHLPVEPLAADWAAGAGGLAPERFASPDLPSVPLPPDRPWTSPFRDCRYQGFPAVIRILIKCLRSNHSSLPKPYIPYWPPYWPPYWLPYVPVL